MKYFSEYVNYAKKANASIPRLAWLHEIVLNKCKLYWKGDILTIYKINLTELGLEPTYQEKVTLNIIKVKTYWDGYE